MVEVVQRMSTWWFSSGSQVTTSRIVEPWWEAKDGKSIPKVPKDGSYLDFG